jgi:hypothetical protein
VMGQRAQIMGAEGRPAGRCCLQADSGAARGLPTLALDHSALWCRVGTREPQRKKERAGTRPALPSDHF